MILAKNDSEDNPLPLFLALEGQDIPVLTKIANTDKLGSASDNFFQRLAVATAIGGTPEAFQLLGELNLFGQFADFLPAFFEIGQGLFNRGGASVEIPVAGFGDFSFLAVGDQQMVDGQLEGVGVFLAFTGFKVDDVNAVLVFQVFQPVDLAAEDDVVVFGEPKIEASPYRF